MSKTDHIVYVYNIKTVEQKYVERKESWIPQKHLGFVETARIPAEGWNPTKFGSWKEKFISTNDTWTTWFC